MMRRRATRLLLVAVLVAVGFGVAGRSHAQFTSMTDHATAMLEGNWQSCREEGGGYSERVYDGKWAGLGQFELHMGPYHEFALFRGIQDGHREHASSENLLRPFNIELVGNNARHSWNVAGMRLDVTLAGGSREQCESWYVTLKRSTTSSH
jgi:hypothetical protein